MIRRWRKRRACFHHDHSTGTSWLLSQIIDGGRKHWWCTAGGKGWFR